MPDAQSSKPLSPDFILPTAPTNVIFTGVAGTVKTHRLLQIQKAYDGKFSVTPDEWRASQLADYRWLDALCAVMLLENRLLTVPEIIRHPLMQDKIAQQNNANIAQTLWGILGQYSHPDSVTVQSSQRFSQYYFDKTEASQWYLLDDVKADLQTKLADLLALYSPSNTMPTSFNPQKIVRTAFVSFHQSYGYDEFVEGIRPSVDTQTGQMQYRITDGAFLRLCAKASADPDHRYAMLIDEINRANTVQVFGELMSLIEPSKRAGLGDVQNNGMQISLAYSQRPFSVPSNVDIYATMNTQDASLTMLDSAFRRRFTFIDCPPNPDLLPVLTDKKSIKLDLAQLLTAINTRLADLFGNEARLGHAYFMPVTDLSSFAEQMAGQILPQIINLLSQHLPSSVLAEELSIILYGANADSTTTPSLINEHGQIAEGLRQFAEYKLGKGMSDFADIDDLLPNAKVFLTTEPYRMIYEENDL